MEPRRATDEEVEFWSIRYGTTARRAEISGPGEMPEVLPCPAIVMPEPGAIAVCWELNEIELAQLAQGGKLWLTTWGGLPIHSLEVIQKR